MSIANLNFNIFRYLYIYYLPSGLFVVVSWVSFLIPPEVVPGRMALLVTLFLVLTNIFNTINNLSPNVEGMNAMASWMIACMFFVFGALVGYGSILYFLLVSTIQLSPWCISNLIGLAGEEKDSIGQKEEKPDCDSLERLLPIPRVRAQQAEGWDCWNRPETEASSSGQHFQLCLPPHVPSF